jgi:hypothetical protein
MLSDINNQCNQQRINVVTKNSMQSPSKIGKSVEKHIKNPLFHHQYNLFLLLQLVNQCNQLTYTKTNYFDRLPYNVVKMSTGVKISIVGWMHGWMEQLLMEAVLLHASLCLG